MGDIRSLSGRIGMTNTWTLIRSLQPQMRQFGYHLCLGGGVLNNGWSEKDLDLYFLPLSPFDGKAKELKAWLDGLWGTGVDLRNIALTRIAEEVPEYPDDPMYQEKLKYSFSDLRIDVFIMRNGGKDD